MEWMAGVFRLSFWKIVLLVVAVGIALVLTLAALRYADFYFSAKTEWQHTREKLLSQGEKLTLLEFAPTPLADAVNFFGDPVWKELADLVPTKDGVSKEPRIPEGQRQLDKLNPPLTKEEIADLKSNHPGLAWPENVEKRSSLVVFAWNNNTPQASPEQMRSTAEFVLEVLAPAKPLLDKIYESAQRPNALFPVHYEDDFVAALPHITYLLAAGQMLSIRARANLVLGNTNEAFEDTKLLFQLSDATRNEPLLILLLVRVAITRLGLVCFSEGIKVHAWKDDQLVDFGRVLTHFDFIPDLIHVIRAERGAFNQMISRVQKRPEIAKDILNACLFEKNKIESFYIPPWLRDIWLWSDASAYNQVIQKWIETLKRTSADGFTTKDIIPQEIARLKGVKYHQLFSLFTLLSLQTMKGIGEKLADAQDRIIQAQITCALERFWLKDGAYPETLAKLVPEFLPAEPNDVVDLQPMKYRCVAPNEYQLYSIGMNRIDEGGNPGVKGEGDWVWGFWKQ